MVRAPCCDKMGLKKGPWTPEEDQILVSYIKRFGHGNWRALPKQAGLLRCGKSCRLRWINYLRPDIKRGNFSCEEEETIVRLHQIIGNRWSAIAERLPGRTDNEIKNYWHSRLKKRFQQHLATPTAGISNGQGMKAPTSGNAGIINGRTSQPINHISDHQKRQNLGLPSASSQESSSQESLSYVTTMEAATDFDGGNDMKFWYDLFMGSSKLDRTLNFL